VAVTLTPPGCEIRQLDNLKSLLAGSAAWETWTGLSDLADRAARIASPEYSGTGKLPAIVLAPGSTRRERVSGTSGNPVIARGRIHVVCFEAVDTEVAYAVDWRRAVGNFTALLDELATDSALSAWQSPMRIISVETSEPIGRRTDIVTEDDLDETDAAAELEELFSGPVWLLSGWVSWGPVG